LAAIQILIGRINNNVLINIAGGTGRMGQAHATLLEKRGHEVILSGRETSPNLEEAARKADVTIFSFPLNVTQKMIKELAPFCKCVMDFSSVKCLPIHWMLERTNYSVEVAGLHPLYGQIFDPRSQTMVYCPTPLTGKKCLEVIEDFSRSGLQMVKMSAAEHDKYILKKQNERVQMLLKRGLSFMDKGRDIIATYRLAPTSERVILDLIARQIAPRNDEMYLYMRKLNPFQCEITKRERILLTTAPQKLRDFYGNYLEIAQARAEKIVSIA
jgi:prephenate dehydrogenase